MDIRFVQGFMDETKRQLQLRASLKAQATRQAGPPAPPGQVAYAATGAGPSGMIGQPGGGATGRPPVRPQTRPTPLPDYVVASGGSYVPPASQPPAVDQMTQLENQRGTYRANIRPAIMDLQGQQQATHGTPQVEAVVAPSGEVVAPSPDQPMLGPQQQEIGMLAQPGEQSFRTTQRTDATVAQHAGSRASAAAAPHVTRAAEIQNEMFALQNEQDALLAGGATDDYATYERSVEIDNEMARLSAELNEEVGSATEALGAPTGGMALAGQLVAIIAAPGEWGGGKLGDLGYWYAANKGDSNAATVIGLIANSPLGSVLAADGVGASDYIRWIDEHPDEVAYVQANGYTNPTTQQHYEGGDALFQYYLSSLNLAQSVVTQAYVDPTSYVGLTGALGRRLAGTSATRFLPEGAVGRRASLGMGVRAAVPEGAAADVGVVPAMDVTLAREGWTRGPRRALGQALQVPQAVFDTAADEVVAAGFRGLGSVAGGVLDLRNTLAGGVRTVGGALDVPLTQQANNIIENIGSVLQAERVGQRQLDTGLQGPPPGRPGPTTPFDVGDVAPPTPYQETVTPEGVVISGDDLQNPVVVARQREDLVRRSNEAYRAGDTETGQFLDAEIARLDATQSVAVETPEPPPVTMTNFIDVPSQRPVDEGLALPERVGPEDPFRGAPEPEEPDLTPPRTYTVYTRPEDITTEVQSPTETLYDPGAGEEIVVKRGGKKKDGTYNYRVEIDGVMAEGPTTQEDADRYARSYIMQNQPPQPPTAITEPVPATAPLDPDLIDPDDPVVYRVNDDGSVTPVVEGEELFAEEFPSVYDAQRAVADLEADDLAPERAAVEVSPVATGEETLPTDISRYNQIGMGREKMVDVVTANEDDYVTRGLAPLVDRWYKWRANFVGEGELTETTPPLQSVTNRAQEDIAFREIVGEAPPPQTLRADPDAIRTFAEAAELAAFGRTEKIRSNARKWLRTRKGRAIGGEANWSVPEFRAYPIRTYGDAADYLKWLRDHIDSTRKLTDEEQIVRFGSGFGSATFDLPSFQEFNRMLREFVGERSASRQIKRARLAAARARTGTRPRIKRGTITQPGTPGAALPPGVSRSPILASADERLLNTRIADLGPVGRADTVKDGVITPRGRGQGDQSTVRQVYQQAYDTAKAAGKTDDEAYTAGMTAVANRIRADFGVTEDVPTGGIGGFFDTAASWHSQATRHGTPIHSARSAISDFIGNMMQAGLREGPATPIKMAETAFNYMRRGRVWENTRAGEIMGEWGYAPSSFTPPNTAIRAAEQAGGGRSAAEKVLAPNFGKLKIAGKNVTLDTKWNPGRAWAKTMNWTRGISDQIEVGARSGMKLFLADEKMLKAARGMDRVALRSRHLAGTEILDNEIASTVSALGPRFSREDIRLAMERLAVAKGATKENAAKWGDRVGRDWAGLQRAAIDDAHKRTNKALFSYEYTNLDRGIRRAIPFHYWATRAIPFYLETAVRNPALALAYYRTIEGLAERAEEEGWPESLKFLTKIWSGPFGYIFFIDPIANAGLLGFVEMLFPSTYQDETKSALGSAIETISNRTGVGLSPLITSMLNGLGYMGESTLGLDPTSTTGTRELIWAAFQAAAGHGVGVEDPTLLGKPFDEMLMRGREVISGILPGSKNIPATDPNAYANVQIRNGMVTALMEDRVYTDQAQMTEEDWVLINDQYGAREGQYYEDALANWSDANFFDRTVGGLFVGRTPFREEGQLARQSQDRRQNPNAEFDISAAAAGAPPTNPTPGDIREWRGPWRSGQQPDISGRTGPRPGEALPPSMANQGIATQYESSANLEGRYGRTPGGVSLPEYDPYADYTLTEGERMFMRLWQLEFGEPYEMGDLEAMREGEQYSREMTNTTAEAAPYVGAEEGYFNAGPESASPIITQYWNIVYADEAAEPIDTIFIGEESFTGQELAQMSESERGEVADAWLASRDADGSVRRTIEERKLWVEAHPEYGLYRDWKRETEDAWEDSGGLAAYRTEVSRGNPNAERYFADLEREVRADLEAEARRKRTGPGLPGYVEPTPAEIRAELDRRTTSLDAYLAINGIQRRLDDPKPVGTGDASRVPGPFDPRPVGWAAPSDSGDGGSAGNANGTGSSSGFGGSDKTRSPSGGQSRGQSREEWAISTIQASESGVAQANALLTQQLGYAVDITQLPSGIQDAALAMLPPGLIPEDAWLYFDYLDWQQYQAQNGGPQDLLSYLAATANNREWKPRRTSFQAGGASLVGQLPPSPYIPPSGSGSFSSYLSGS